MSPDKLKRSVEIFLNHAGEFTAQLSLHTRHQTHSRQMCEAMLWISPETAARVLTTVHICVGAL